jgi:hypothetical protein
MGEAVSTFYHSTTRRLLSHPSFQLMGAFISAHGTMAAEAFLIGKVIAYVGEAVAWSCFVSAAHPQKAAGPTLTAFRVQTDPLLEPYPGSPGRPPFPGNQLLALASPLGCAGPAHRRSRDMIFWELLCRG